MKVAEVMTVTKKLGQIDRADHVARDVAGADQGACHDRTPSAAADGVEHAAAETDDGHAPLGRLNSGEPAHCAQE